MDNYIKFKIPSFNIEFLHPDWWNKKVEQNETYLFWDEYTGSFRITPLLINTPNFSIEQFLQSQFNRNSNLNPIWKVFNSRKFLYYEDSNANKEQTKLHYYISGQGNTLITCSFAYNKELLNDEYSKEEVEEALEQVDNILNSLTM